MLGSPAGCIPLPEASVHLRVPWKLVLKELFRLVHIQGPLVFVFEVHGIVSNRGTLSTSGGGQPRAVEIAWEFWESLGQF